MQDEAVPNILDVTANPQFVTHFTWLISTEAKKKNCLFKVSKGKKKNMTNIIDGSQGKK